MHVRAARFGLLCLLGCSCLLCLLGCHCKQLHSRVHAHSAQNTDRSLLRLTQAQHSMVQVAATQCLAPLQQQASSVLRGTTSVAETNVHFHRAVQLLSSCLMFTEEQVSHHLPKLLPALSQVCMSAVATTQWHYHHLSSPIVDSAAQPLTQWHYHQLSGTIINSAALSPTQWYHHCNKPVNS